MKESTHTRAHPNGVVEVTSCIGQCHARRYEQYSASGWCKHRPLHPFSDTREGGKGEKGGGGGIASN